MSPHVKICKGRQGEEEEKVSEVSNLVKEKSNLSSVDKGPQGIIRKHFIS